MGAAWIFDLDGTLCDSARGIRNSMGAAFYELGLPPPVPEEVLIGPPIGLTIRTLLKEKADSHFDITLKTFRKHYGETGLFEADLYPGIRDLLDELRAREIPLYVATAKLESFAIRLLEHQKIAPYFKKIYGSRADGSLSLKSDLVRFVRAQHPEIPNTSFMIGDRHYDIDAAVQTNLIGVAVDWGYGNHEEFLRAGAHHIVKSVTELAALLPTR